MRVHRDEFAMQTDTWDAQDKCRLCMNDRTTKTYAVLPSVCFNCVDLPQWKIDLLEP